MNNQKIQGVLLFFVVLSLAAACGSPNDEKMAFYAKGKELMAQEEYVKAELEFKNAIQIDPEYADAYYMLGQVAIKRKQFQNAFKFYKKTTSLDPDNLDAQVEIGKMLLSAKKQLEARDQAEYVLNKDPKHAQGRILMATINLSQQQTEKGERMLHELLDEGQTMETIYLLLASSKGKQKDLPGFQRILETGLEKNPDSIPILIRLARIAAKDKKFDDARKYQEKVISLQPDAVPHKLAMAQLYLAKDGADAAEKYLNSVIDQALPEDKDTVTVQVAAFLVKIQQAQKAEAVLEKSLAADKNSTEARLFLTELYAKTKRIDQAETLLKEALTLNKDPGAPDTIKAKLALARVLLIKADVEGSEKLVDQILAEDTNNLDAKDLKGGFYLNRRDGLNAISQFRVIVQEKPELEKGYINLARAHLLNKEKELAIDVLENGHKKLPNSDNILIVLIRIKMAMGDTDGAEENLKEYVKLGPDNTKARISLGEFYLTLKEYDKALEQFSILKTEKPDSPAGFIKTAQVYIQMKDKEKALAELEQGYEKFYDSAILLSRLTQFYLAEKQNDKALALCKIRLEKNPEEIFTWNLLGNIYFLNKEYDKAKAHFEKAIELNPAWNMPYDNLAKLYLIQGKKDSAVQKIEQTLKQNNKNTKAWMLLGSIYVRDQDYETAARVYKDAFESNPSLWAAANNYAYILSENLGTGNDYSLALEYAQKAVALNNRSAMARDTLGWIYYKMGKLDKAYDELKTGLKQSADHLFLNYHIGMVLEQQGKHDEAVSYFEAALEKNTDFAGAENARKLIKQYEVE